MKGSSTCKKLASCVVQHQVGEQDEVGVRDADLELERLHQLEDGRPRDELLVSLLAVAAVAVVADAKQVRELQRGAVLDAVRHQLGHRVQHQAVVLAAGHAQHRGHDVEQALDLRQLDGVLGAVALPAGLAPAHDGVGPRGHDDADPGAGDAGGLAWRGGHADGVGGRHPGARGHGPGGGPCEAPQAAEEELAGREHVGPAARELELDALEVAGQVGQAHVQVVHWQRLLLVHLLHQHGHRH